MSIARLSYVRCDRCGNPAQPGDDGIEARKIARGEGWLRIDSEDICLFCKRDLPASVVARVRASDAKQGRG